MAAHWLVQNACIPHGFTVVVEAGLYIEGTGVGLRM